MLCTTHPPSSRVSKVEILAYRYQGDTKLKPSKRIIYEHDGTKYSLLIKETVVKETGPITVKATNPVGTMSATAQLKVNG